MVEGYGVRGVEVNGGGEVVECVGPALELDEREAAVEPRSGVDRVLVGELRQVLDGRVPRPDARYERKLVIIHLFIY